MSDPTSPLVERMQAFGTTVFAKTSALAAHWDAINLGQGYPDYDGPPAVLEAAVDAIRSGHNQYPPGRGVPALKEAIAAHQSRFYGLDVDPTTQVLVTVGATEAIAAAVLALCDEGDEIVVFDPAYDSYAATAALARATLRTCPLRFPDLSFDVDQLRSLFSPATAVVLLNSPHNPTGKVFTRDELTTIAQLAREFDAWVITDEVYEHLLYDDAVHVPMASLPGMAARTLTVSSAGKTFSVTGWKVGWASGPAPLVEAVHTVKQFLTFVPAGPFQHAVATALALPDAQYAAIAQDCTRQRDILVTGLREVGFEVTAPAAGYFVMADGAGLGIDDGQAWCDALPERAGVAAIPVSALSNQPQAASLIRFALCKRPELLQRAVRALHAAAP